MRTLGELYRSKNLRGRIQLLEPCAKPSSRSNLASRSVVGRYLVQVNSCPGRTLPIYGLAVIRPSDLPFPNSGLSCAICAGRLNLGLKKVRTSQEAKFNDHHERVMAN